MTNKRIGIGVTILAGIIGLAGCIAFALIGGFVTMAVGSSLHLSTAEGAQGYLAVAVSGLAGVIGFFVSSLLFLRARGLGAAQLVIGTTSAAGLVLIVAAAAVGIWYSMQPHVLNPNGPEPLLRLELRVPPAVATASLNDCTAELSTDRNSADVIFDPPEAGASTRRGYVPLYYRTSRRLLVLKLPDRSARLYNLRLPARPLSAKYSNWSEWQRPDFVDQPGSSGPVRASAAADIELRYRVETAGG